MALKTSAQRRAWARHRRILAGFIAGRRSLTGAFVASPPTQREQDERRAGW